MISRNHEATGFATVCLCASLAGVPTVGAIMLGMIGAWAADWPDIDHPGATATKSLRWLPYWIDFPRDKKTGDHKRRKDGRIVWKTRWFPARQVHGFFAWVSRTLYDRFATPADRADTTGTWGPAFRVHRGFTHSVWCAGLTGVAWWGAAAPWSIWAPLAPLFGSASFPVLLGETTCMGMLTHVAGDGCTDFGVSPFAPLISWKGRRYPRLGIWEPLRFKVSKSVEKIIILPLCSALVVYAVAGAFLGPLRVGSSLWTLVSSLWSRLA